MNDYGNIRLKCGARGTSNTLAFALKFSKRFFLIPPLPTLFTFLGPSPSCPAPSFGERRKWRHLAALQMEKDQKIR